MKVKKLQLVDKVTLINVEVGFTTWQLADYIPVVDGNKLLMIHKDKIVGFEANEDSKILDDIRKGRNL